VQGTVTGPGRVTIAGLLPRTAEVHTDTQTTASISAERAPQRAE
jgi:hypothetical protein